MAKRIIVCCDGTWDTSKQKNPTNVYRLSQAVAPIGSDGVEQRAVYRNGVGTDRGDKLRGGAFGLGLSKIVKAAYLAVVDNYEVGDQLYFLGFSRGAFTVRSTVGFIRNAGILRSTEAHRVDEAYAMYRNEDPPDSPRAVAFRGAYSVLDRTPIRFIGVWDTVGSLGIPVLWPWMAVLNKRWQFHDVDLSSTVASAFQALAIDEARRPFTPSVWKQQAHATDQELEQVWFTGVHCDVGGGYPQHQLSDITMRWMQLRAQACGVEFSDPVLPLDPSGPDGDLHRTNTGLYRFFCTSRTLGHTDAKHEAVSSTALERHDYDPPNLVKYRAGPHNETTID